MAEVYHLPVRNRFFYIYRPALKPFLYSGMKISLGMCWKSGVAAEVIGIPDYSIGERLYLSKIYLDTAGVFAWTAIVILLSVLFEKLILRVTRWFFDAYNPTCRRPVSHAKNQIADDGNVIVAKDLTKSFDGKIIFSHVDAAIKRGQTCVLKQPSGSGKTTFLRLVAGLERPSAGSLIVRGTVSMVFQEDRLCEQYDAVKNVELVCGDDSRAAEALRMLLPEDALYKPCAALSGGMRRRVALARAMEAESDILLFDEPFTGMDEATRERAQSYMDTLRRNRTILLVTHI
jgi:ABC-type transporter Mla maintaining outer membrane lipid asymmetry ATPase subunit MlaF